MDALAGLVDAVRQLEGLTEQVGPFALYHDTTDRAPDVVAAVCRALDVPLTFDRPMRGRGRDYATVALGAELKRAQRVPELAGLAPAEAAAGARHRYAAEEAGYRRGCVRRPDGTELSVVEAGPPDAPAVVLSAPCGMGYRLSLPWLAALRPAYRCVVAEARGTAGPVGDPAEFDRRGYGVEQQTGDLLAVAGSLGAGPVHVMGLCAGAAVALAAAARQPELIGSVSLWHADLELGGEAEKSDHQINMRAMLDLATESRDTAAWLRDKLVAGPLTGVPQRVGPLVVRPYATPELFYRYAALTRSTMHWDSRPAAEQAGRPCLIVTSADDETAHPAGSRRLAALMPGARLAVTPHGGHLDAFRATPDQVAMLRTFLAG